MKLMAKPKKKLLPKDFEALLKKGDVDVLKAVFEITDVNARGGYSKQTALAYNDCPDELAQWLVASGAEVSAQDSYGATPLHSRAGHWQGRIDTLLQLGADVHAIDQRGNTPLHDAARVRNVAAARTLLQYCARADTLNKDQQTPLVHALQDCDNNKITGVADIAELLLAAEACKSKQASSLFSKILGRDQGSSSTVTAEMKEHVQRIGTNFEFHRAGFNRETVGETSAGLDKLYALFGVEPVPRRVVHDGKTPIIANASRWEDRHQELWQLLVPSEGAASTVQGEVVRISGQIADELERNGGVNWDADYKRMADAFLAHVGSGVPLPAAALADAGRLIGDVKRRAGDTQRLCELAVAWVALNPNAIRLDKPTYAR